MNELINNVIIFNEDLEILGFIAQTNIYKNELVYKDDLLYIAVNKEEYFILKEKHKEYKIKFSEIPTLENILNKCIFTPLPPAPLTQEEITNKAILEQTIAISGLTETANNLSAKTQCLADGLMQGISKQSTLEEKVNVLSKALLEIAMKGMK